MLDATREAARLFAPKPAMAQPTRHQELAAQLATRLGEPKKTAAYVRIFMENGVVEDKIEECVRWVLSRPFEVRNRGALFMSQYRKFITGQ